MQAWVFLAAWFLLGLGVCYIAFRGGFSAQKRRTRGASPALRVGVPLAVLALGIGIPAYVITQTGQTEGGPGHLAAVQPTAQIEHGKTLFRQTCAGCHTLGAVGAQGVTGPDLDSIGSVNQERVLSAIRVGGIGDGRMPPNLLTGSDAQDVAAFVSTVAGR